MTGDCRKFLTGLIGAPIAQSASPAMHELAADALGVPFESVDVVGGDTATIAYGIGTIASRSTVTACWRPCTSMSKRRSRAPEKCVITVVSSR